MNNIRLLPIRYLPTTEAAENEDCGPCHIFQKKILSFLELYPFNHTIKNILPVLVSPELGLQGEVEQYGFDHLIDPYLNEIEYIDFFCLPEEEQMALFRQEDLIILLGYGVTKIIYELYGEGFLDTVSGVDKWLKRYYKRTERRAFKLTKKILSRFVPSHSASTEGSTTTNDSTSEKKTS